MSIPSIASGGGGAGNGGTGKGWYVLKWWMLTIFARETGLVRDAGGDETADDIEGDRCLGVVVPPRPPADETEILRCCCALKLEGTDGDGGPPLLLPLTPKALTAKEETLLFTRIAGGLVDTCDPTGEGDLALMGLEVVSGDAGPAGPASYSPTPTEEDAGECVLNVDVSLTLLFRKWLRVVLIFAVGRSDEPTDTVPAPVPLIIMEVGRSLGDPGSECVDAIARSVGVGDVTLAEAEANFGDEDDDEVTGFALAGPPITLRARGIAIVAELPAGIADLSFC